jgi:colanic acid/amylovoran biosynthesis glycosyltransferase
MTTPRLAYLLKKFPRTSETFILNELLGLEGQGMELRVLSRRQPDDEPRHPELSRLKAEIEYLPAARHVDPWSVLFGGDAAHRKELMARLGAVVDDFGSLGHPRFPSLLAEALHLRGRTLELGIAHIHTHFATDAAVVANLVHALGGPGYSLTLHAKDIYRDTVDRTILDRLIGDSRFSVTVCDANVRHLHELIGDEAKSRLRRLYNGIDLEAHKHQDLERDTDHVLAVGRLVEKKGFDLLLDALHQLIGAGRNVRATIVGEGEERSSLEADIATRGLSDHVTLVGALGQDGVRELMAHATCMALPCRIGEDGNRDALPTVLLEAQACGLPIVSTPVTGIPEILDQGNAGLLVPEGDAAALSERLGALLDDSDLRGRLSAAGLARARELFDLKKNAKILHAWHGEALSAS